MADFGIIAVPTHYTITPVDLARWAEDQGFESIWFGEHSHIPTSRKSPFPLGGDLPLYYREFFDPFIGLTAAAAVTTKLKVGTSVCLVPEHNTMNLAKMISCLDQVAKGRFLFGIGAGWNAEEMADHGAEFKDRWKITRERVYAMREIWTKEVAEFHGKHVNFEPLWSWPKPLQAGGPPVLLGAWSKYVAKRVAEYCDGWIPIDLGIDLEGAIKEIRSEAAKLGRGDFKFDFTAGTSFDLQPPEKIEGRINDLIKIGFNRICFLIPVTTPDKQWKVLERYAALMKKFQ
ncbi:MAG TPA: LLM class F420-dependent oxidoreductase [Candidatus Binataceae bacterium]|nr:LLM class F420-dependent oxidoreductase [Candidatus Binataceae bacterium]